MDHRPQQSLLAEQVGGPVRIVWTEAESVCQSTGACHMVSPCIDNRPSPGMDPGWALRKVAATLLVPPGERTKTSPATSVTTPRTSMLVSIAAPNPNPERRAPPAREVSTRTRYPSVLVPRVANWLEAT